MRKKDLQSAPAQRLATLMATKPGDVVEVRTEKEMSKLPDGHYEVAADTMTIRVRGTKLTQEFGYPTLVRRLS